LEIPEIDEDLDIHIAGLYDELTSYERKRGADYGSPGL
jgi:hypothetical protein